MNNFIIPSIIPSVKILKLKLKFHVIRVARDLGVYPAETGMGLWTGHKAH